MKKLIFYILIISIIAIIIVGMGYLLILTGAIFMFNSNPPAPKIKYGEFPCRLVYEINGEQKVIEDTIVCEFDGFKNFGSAGNYRQWKTYMKSQKEEWSSKQTGNAKNNSVAITLLDLQNDDICDGHKILRLFFYGGSGHYYMNDTLGSLDREAQDFSRVDYSYKTLDGTIGYSGAYKAEEAYERFKIKLISWEVAPPIQNEFQ